MRVSVYLPLIVSALLALGSPLMARRLSPVSATRALSAAGAIAAVASTWGLALLAITLAGRVAFVAEQAHWSRAVLLATDPVPSVVGIAAAVVLALALTGFVRVARARLEGLRDARHLCRGSATTEMIVLSEDTPLALAVPGQPGRIVVSTGMLQALSGPQRRALLAHERSHLRHHHHRYLCVVDLAATLNPLLSGIRHDVTYLVERWADEDASEDVQSRHLAAGALATAAIASTGRRSPATPALAFENLGVAQRVAALHAPPLRPRPLIGAAAVAVAAISTFAVIDATAALTHLLDAARLAR